MKTARDPQELRRMWLYGAAIAAYAAVWYGWPILSPDEERPIQLYIPLVYTATVILHELGHLAAAAMAGMRFREIMVFGVKLSRTESGWSWSAGGFHLGGHAGAIPVGLDRLPARLTVFTLGGPVTEALSIVAALLLFLVWPGSPVLIMWVILGTIGLYWSFVKDQKNDLWHLRQAQGKDETARKYIAAYVQAAEGVDEEERQRYLTELGFPNATREREMSRFIKEMRFGELREHLEGVLAADDFTKVEDRVWYECTAAFYYAYQGFDVERAIQHLPPETRAKVYNAEHVWLYAAVLIAGVQKRWSDVESYAQRGFDHRDADEDAQRWFEMAKRSAQRHLERASRA